MPRPARARLTVALAPLAVLAMLSGCVTSEPMPDPPPTPDVQPVFASDEEALAAAEEAYRAYSSAADAILADSGDGADRLEGLATRELIEEQSAGFALFRDKGWRAVGTTKLENFTLQQVVAGSPTTVIIYVCSDVSDVDVVDAAGRSQVAPSRPARTAFEARLTHDGQKLLVAADDPWTGGGVC